MPDRYKNQQEVRSYLQKHFSAHHWQFSLPGGSGMETYFVQGNEQELFVKVGAPLERYSAMADLGLAPPILQCGYLENGLSILVQPLVKGQMPTRSDFQARLEEVARVIRKMHFDPHVQKALPQPGSILHKDVGKQALAHLLQRWERYKTLVPEVSSFVDQSLEGLARQINRFSSEGLAACHNDICNGNWLFGTDGKIYLLDLDSLSLDDPALDMGALLWWYYPPEQRKKFLTIAGYPYSDEFKDRMQVRMALHCLNITIPRDQGFEAFRTEHYSDALTDFRAVLQGRENPQGYAA